MSVCVDNLVVSNLEVVQEGLVASAGKTTNATDNVATMIVQKGPRRSNRLVRPRVAAMSWVHYSL